MKKYSYLPGFLLIVVAVFRASWVASWDAADSWLFAGGLVIVAWSVVWNWRDVIEWFHDPRGIFAVNTGITLVLFVGVLVLLNMLTWYRPLSVDLTATGRNSLTPDTRKLLDDLKTDIKFRQFGRLRDPRVDQRLEAFAEASRRISVDFVDAERSAREARELSVVKNGTVIVSARGKYRKVEEITEQALATAIIQVTSDSTPVVCLTTGHGERSLNDTSGAGLSRLRDVLKASNFNLQPVSLLSGDVPAACHAVVLVGPQRELDTLERERLTGFVAKGGRVGVLVDPAPAASLASWLTEWGITPTEGVIVDESGTGRAVGGGPEMPLALVYGDHPITRGFGVATMYDGARSLETKGFGDRGGKPVVLAQTSEQSFVRTARLTASAKATAVRRSFTRRRKPGTTNEGRKPDPTNEGLRPDPTNDGAATTNGLEPGTGSEPASVRSRGGSLDPPVGSSGRQGPQTLAVATSLNTRSRRGGLSPFNDEARIVVFGDSDFVSNAVLSRQGNRDLFIRTVSWLVGEAERHVVSVGERENRRINLSERMKSWMYVVNLALIPLIPLTGGIIAFVRSKR